MVWQFSGDLTDIKFHCLRNQGEEITRGFEICYKVLQFESFD